MSYDYYQRVYWNISREMKNSSFSYRRCKSDRVSEVSAYLTGILAAFLVTSAQHIVRYPMRWIFRGAALGIRNDRDDNLL